MLPLWLGGVEGGGGHDVSEVSSLAEEDPGRLEQPQTNLLLAQDGSVDRVIF